MTAGIADRSVKTLKASDPGIESRDRFGTDNRRPELAVESELLRGRGKRKLPPRGISEDGLISESVAGSELCAAAGGKIVPRDRSRCSGVIIAEQEKLKMSLRICRHSGSPPTD
jgi:hypothetical protein